MPYHRVPRTSIYEDLKQIEREGEQVESVVNDALSDVFHIFTSYRSPRIVVDTVYETRGDQ